MANEKAKKAQKFEDVRKLKSRKQQVAIIVRNKGQKKIGK